jgi:hypothetical protein
VEHLKGENTKLKHRNSELQQENQGLLIQIQALQEGFDVERTSQRLTIQQEISRELWSQNQTKDVALDRLCSSSQVTANDLRMSQQEKRKLENKCHDLDGRLRTTENSFKELQQEMIDLDVVELYRAWSPIDDLKERHRKLEDTCRDLQCMVKKQESALQLKDHKLKEFQEEHSLAVFHGFVGPNPKQDHHRISALPNLYASRFFSDAWGMHMWKRIHNKNQVCLARPSPRPPSSYLFPSVGRLLQRLPVK